MYNIPSYNPLAKVRKMSAKLIVDTACSLEAYTVTPASGTTASVADPDITVSAAGATASLSIIHNTYGTLLNSKKNTRTNGLTITSSSSKLPFTLQIDFYLYYQLNGTYNDRLYITKTYTINQTVQELPFTLAADKVVITITSATGGIETKIRNGIRKEYGPDKIIKADTNSQLTPGGNSIPAGSLKIDLANTANSFETEDEESFINNLNRFTKIQLQLKCQDSMEYQNVWTGFYDEHSFAHDNSFVSLSATDLMNNRPLTYQSTLSSGNFSASEATVFGKKLGLTDYIYPSDRNNYAVRVAQSYSIDKTDRNMVKDLALFFCCDAYVNRDGTLVFRDISAEAESEPTETFSSSGTLIDTPALRIDDSYNEIKLCVEAGTTSATKKILAQNLSEMVLNESRTLERDVEYIPPKVGSYLYNRADWSALWLLKRENLKRIYYFRDRGNLNRELGDYVKVPFRNGFVHGYITRLDYSFDGGLASYIEISSEKDADAVFSTGSYT